MSPAFWLDTVSCNCPSLEGSCAVNLLCHLFAYQSYRFIGQDTVPLVHK
jgi:hypothetical protein